jgi:hypothetical protein
MRHEAGIWADGSITAVEWRNAGFDVVVTFSIFGF